MASKKIAQGSPPKSPKKTEAQTQRSKTPTPDSSLKSSPRRRGPAQKSSRSASTENKPKSVRQGRVESSIKLRQSDATAQQLIEIASQGVIAIAPTERIVRINRAACRIFRYARKELLGQKLNLLLPRGSRKDHSSDIASFFRTPKRRMMADGRIVKGRRKDGELFPAEIALGLLEVEHSRLAVAFVTDVSRRTRVEDDLLRSHERLRRLAQQATMAAEEQNRKWAQELHDVYSQQLVSIAMELSRAASEDGEHKGLRALERKIQNLARDVHLLSRRLHPSILHDLGLVAALKAEVTEHERQYGLRIQFDAANVPDTLPDNLALCLYRVAQESLRNIRKHSNSHRVSVDLTGTQRSLTLMIEDIGDGFELDQALHKGGLGLTSMEERVHGVGGSFSVKSTPGKGTTVRAAVPLKPAGKAGNP